MYKLAVGRPSITYTFVSACPPSTLSTPLPLRARRVCTLSMHASHSGKIIDRRPGCATALPAFSKSSIRASASTSSIPETPSFDARTLDVTSEMAKIFSDDPRSLPPSRKLWSSVGSWPNPGRYSDRSQSANWLRTTTSNDGSLEWHYPMARYSVPVPGHWYRWWCAAS